MKSLVCAVALFTVLAVALPHAAGYAQSAIEEAPPPPPGTERVLSFDRHGDQTAVCAENPGGPITRGSRQIAPTEVWYANPTTVRKTATGLGTCDPDWSPDGRHLVVSAPDGLWVIYDVWNNQEGDSGKRLVDIGQQARKDAATEYEAVSRPRWSPDGRKIAYLATNGATSWVEVIDIETSERIFRSSPGVEQYDWTGDSRALTIGAKTVPIS